jgi:hypothetical protein
MKQLCGKPRLIASAIVRDYHFNLTRCDDHKWVIPIRFVKPLFDTPHRSYHAFGFDKEKRVIKLAREVRLVENVCFGEIDLVLSGMNLKSFDGFKKQIHASLKRAIKAFSIDFNFFGFVF